MTNLRKTIPKDVERRRLMNAQMKMGNKRGVPLTEYKTKATQEINPITGQAYLTKFNGVEYVRNEDLRIELESINMPPNSILGNFIDKESYIRNTNYGENLDMSRKKIPKSTTNDFIEYQFALARIDVRDKTKEMSKFDYTAARRRIKYSIEKMNEADISLEIISSPQGLDAELKKREHADLIESKSDKIPFSKYDKRNIIKLKPNLEEFADKGYKTYPFPKIN